jgi:hypothetical protein
MKGAIKIYITDNNGRVITVADFTFTIDLDHPQGAYSKAEMNL